MLFFFHFPLIARVAKNDKGTSKKKEHTLKWLAEQFGNKDKLIYSEVAKSKMAHNQTEIYVNLLTTATDHTLIY